MICPYTIVKDQIMLLNIFPEANIFFLQIHVFNILFFVNDNAL